MPLPGFVKIYNRYPHKFEFCVDMRPYIIEPHSEEVITYEMALLAIKQSMYKIDLDGNPKFGVVVDGDPDFGVPLTKEILVTGDLIKDNTLEFNNPEELEVVKISMSGVQPVRRGAVGPITFMAGKKSNI